MLFFVEDQKLIALVLIKSDDNVKQTENEMNDTIRRPLVSAAKWLSVVAATAVVVISLQVSADNPASPDQSSSVTEKNAQPFNQQAWSPSAGFADLVENVSPAVVHVATKGFIQQRRTSGYGGNQMPRSMEEFLRDFWGFQGSPYDRHEQPERNDEQQENGERETRPLGIGSGFIISQDGYVVTNHHVIAKADEIIVTLPNGDEYDAEIRGSDPKTDLALLKLKDAKNLPTVAWGDDSQSRVGDWVLAIGNPFGLGGSASTGIISALGRDIRSGPYDDFIQVDAAINQGNSGGPLFNMDGRVIGINSMIYSRTGGSIGIGFAIPSSLARGIINQLKASGEVKRGWLGVSIRDLDEELAEAFERDNEEGALVSNVMKESPAEKAGIKNGDIILEFNGVKIEKVRNLTRSVADAPVGKSYPVKVWRDGKIKSMRIKTEPFPDENATAKSSDDKPAKPESSESIGAELVSLNSQMRSRYRVPDDVDGVLLLSVDRGGLADKNRLSAGDVITQVGGKSVKEPDELKRAIKAAKKEGRPSVPVQVSRGGRPPIFIGFKLK